MPEKITSAETRSLFDRAVADANVAEAAKKTATSRKLHKLASALREATMQLTADETAAAMKLN